MWRSATSDIPLEKLTETKGKLKDYAWCVALMWGMIWLFANTVDKLLISFMFKPMDLANSSWSDSPSGLSFLNELL